MSDVVIFNDASLPFPVDIEPHQEIYDFFKSLDILYKAQITIEKRNEVPFSWANLNFSDGFSFGRWLHNNLDRDEKLFVSNVMSKVDCPFTEDIQGYFDSRIFVLTCDDTKSVDALGYASHIDAATLSFASNEIWGRNECRITEHTNEGAPVDKVVQNIGTPCRAGEWAEYTSANRRENVNFLKALEQGGNKDIPNLLFCDRVLKGWQRPGPWCSHQREIVDALTLLNTHIATSTNLNELIEKTGLDISDESVSTRQNPKYIRQRMFIHPNLGRTYFGLHVKNFRDAKRLYFLPDFGPQRTICIGYFGNHLGTTSDPT